MSAPTTTNRRYGALLGGFLLVALLLAGVVSYAASSSPDGLDAATQYGCEAVETEGGEQLQGSCIAQNAGEHATADSPLADYAVGGNDDLTGVAGVVGVMATLLVAGGLFWLLRRGRTTADQRSDDAAQMGAGHAHALHHAGDSVVHRLPAQVKIVVAFVMVLAVVATPREAFWIFGLHLVLLVGIWIAARLPVTAIAVRALIEAPFVVLAVLLPFAAAGPRVEWFGLSLAVDGLLAGWNILVKGTLGVLISVTLGMTTPVRDLLSGLGRLRVPGMVTTIATLMVRYLEVIAAEARRMRLARVARGHDPRFLWQIGPTVRGVGTLFLRSYERGERVHLAMLARGYTGSMPTLGDTTATRRTWARALVPAVVAVLGATTGYALT